MSQLNNLPNPVEKLGTDIKEYGDAKLDTFKLQAAKGMAQGVAAITGYLLLILLASTLLLVLSFGLILLLGEALGSYSNAAFIVAGGLLVLFILVLLLKKFIFKNSFISTFVKAFGATVSYEDGKSIRTREQLNAAIMRSQAREYKQEARLIKHLSRAELLSSPWKLITFLYHRIFG